jgi:hypothetical protein
MLGANPKKNKSTREKRAKVNSPSTCFFSPSGDWHASSAWRCSLRTEASCSLRDWRRSLCEMLI